MAPVFTKTSVNLSSTSNASHHNLGQECGSAPPLAHGVDRDRLEPIAVIGFSARFPQDAKSPESFWQMLKEGRSAMTEVPKDRFNIDSFYHSNAGRHDRVTSSKALK